MLKLPLALLLILVSFQDVAWWNKDWRCRRALTIRNNLTGPLAAGSLVAVELDIANLGLAAKCRPDFEDLAIVSGDKRLAHLLQAGPRDGRTLWFRTAREIAKGGTDPGYAIYYGNASAQTAAKPGEVFEFFDDFSGAAIDDKAWAIEGGLTAGIDKGRLVVTDCPAGRSERLPAKLVIKSSIPRGFSFSAELGYEPAEHAGFTFAVSVDLKDDSANAAATEKRVAELIEKLGEGDPEVRESASKELVKIGKPALKKLSDASQSGDAEVRFRAEQAINEIYTNSPPALIQAAIRAGEGSAGVGTRIVQIGKDKHQYPAAVSPGKKITLSIQRDEEGEVTVLWNGVNLNSGTMKGDVREICFQFWKSLDAPLGKLTIDNVAIRRHMDPFYKPTHVLEAEESRK